MIFTNNYQKNMSILHMSEFTLTMNSITSTYNFSI